MDNKDDKTFTDIFSSSNNESKKTITTFGDILNSSKNEQQKEEPAIITFDNVLKNNGEEKSINDKDTDKGNSETATSFGSLLGTKGEDLDNNLNNNGIENKDKKESDPFLENAIANFENDLKKDIDKIKEDIQVETNPLFEDSENLGEEISNNDSSIISNTNPFINSEIITDKDATTNQNDNIIGLSINPFINNAPSTQEEESGNDGKINQDANPFFEDDKSSIETAINTDNEKKKEETKSVSSSPFFEEEQKQEENPFFINQINLIENSSSPTGKSSNIDTNSTKHYNVKVVKKKEPLIKFIIGVLSYALFIFLLLIGVTLLVYVLDIKIRAAKGDYSSPTFNAYVVLTGSMLPEIKVNDVVVTKKIDAKDLKEGDVITFASADSRFLGTIITHRIIKKNPPSGNEGYTFQTRGDNNNVADSALVPEKNIFGKVIIKIPKLGYLQEFLATDGGWIIVILIPCLTVISYDTVKLIKGLRRKKYKNIKVQK